MVLLSTQNLIRLIDKCINKNFTIFFLAYFNLCILFILLGICDKLLCAVVAPWGARFQDLVATLS